MNQEQLSVVVVVLQGPPSLDKCLRSLEGQTDLLETIVVTNRPRGELAPTAAAFPFATFYYFASDTTIPELRAEGVRLSRTPIVALIEDTCAVAEGWANAHLEAHRLPCAGVGGAVEIDRNARPLDWAMYLLDYGDFIPPLTIRESRRFPGCNLSYKKDALAASQSSWWLGLYETTLNEALHRRGEKLVLCPGAVVSYHGRYGVANAASTFFHHGRTYASLRSNQLGPAKRLGYAMGTPLLPPLLAGRCLVRSARKGRHALQVIRSLPLIVALTCLWACGEALGYLLGPGRSSRAWK
jgi:hypothetical protein